MRPQQPYTLQQSSSNYDARSPTGPALSQLNSQLAQTGSGQLSQSTDVTHAANPSFGSQPGPAAASMRQQQGWVGTLVINCILLNVQFAN